MNISTAQFLLLLIFIVFAMLVMTMLLVNHRIDAQAARLSAIEHLIFGTDAEF